LRLDTFSAVESASFVLLGARRLAADLGLVDLFLYYGAAEDLPSTHGGHGQNTSYSDLKARALSILDLDPSFIYPALYASGTLTFNLDRPQDGLEVLQYALARNPGNAEIGGYIGAIGFSRNGDKRQVIRVLEPYLDMPDCPTMIKSLVAFLDLKTGEIAKAAQIYQEILDTSKDPGYRGIAQRQMEAIQSLAASRLKR
jgi:hypothetical protein